MAEQMIDVKYAGNADPRNANETITLDGRPTLEMHQTGRVTMDEFARLTERGLLLEVLTAEEAKAELTSPHEHVHGTLTHTHDLDFSSKTVTELQGLADAHDLNVTGTGSGGNVTKKDLEDALAAAHA